MIAGSKGPLEGRVIVLTQPHGGVPAGTKIKVIRRNAKTPVDVAVYKVARMDGCRISWAGAWREVAYWDLETELPAVSRWWKFMDGNQ